PGHLPIERGALTPRMRPPPIEPRPREPLSADVVTYDFGNTLVRVDRAGSRAVAFATARALVRERVIEEPGPFLETWAEERDRQFREDVPLGREVDVSQRVVRSLARLRGVEAPGADVPWDDD